MVKKSAEKVFASEPSKEEVRPKGKRGGNYGGGRPPYEPTVQDRRTVMHLAAAGVTHDNIADCVGENGIAVGTLQKHFARELKVSRNIVTGLAMSKMIAGMKNGQAWAICFWLKCRGGFKETQAHQFVDQDGKDRPFMLADADRLIAAADEADEIG